MQAHAHTGADELPPPPPSAPRVEQLSSSVLPPPSYEQACAPTSAIAETEIEGEAPPPPYEEVEAWWNQQSPTNKAQAIQQYEQLSQDHIDALRRRYAIYYRSTISIHYDKPQLTIWDYYVLSQIAGDVTELGIHVNLAAFKGLTIIGKAAAHALAEAAPHVGRAMAGAAPHIARGVVGAAHAIGSGAAHAGKAIAGVGHAVGGSNNDDCGAFMCGLLVLAGLVAAAMAITSSALLSAGYAIKKGFKAIKNICQGKKIASSLLLLAAMGGGAYGGVYGGMLLGALIGSAYPVVGTVLGIVIGGIVGGMLGAGVGTFITKQLTKLASWIVNNDNPNVISATNAGKYQLSAECESSLQAKGINSKAMLTALREQKNANISCMVLPCTAESRQKDEYNALLAEIKKGADVSKPIVVNNARFSWSALSEEWTRKSADQEQRVDCSGNYSRVGCARSA